MDDIRNIHRRLDSTPDNVARNTNAVQPVASAPSANNVNNLRKPIKKKFFSKSKLIISAIILVVIVAVGSFIWWQTARINDLNQKLTTAGANSVSDAEVKKLVEKVGKLMILPDETPALATVDDKTKLAGEEFFKNAENGDKVLIFSASKQAIIYRESQNKIINVGPIVITNDANSNQGGESQ
jgi:cytoskeletal protein RodZ